MLKEFRAFIAKGNVMDMAVGIIIGAAFTAIVSSLVGDLINPIIGLFTGGLDFTNNYAVLAGEVPAGASLEAAREAGASVFAYGSFIMAVINFLIIAFVVFMLVRYVNKIKDAAIKKEAAAPAAPAGPSEIDLLVEIRDSLKARQGAVGS
jgi:large conductance mechanosensitive channel